MKQTEIMSGRDPYSAPVIKAVRVIERRNVCTGSPQMGTEEIKELGGVEWDE